MIWHLLMNKFGYKTFLLLSWIFSRRLTDITINCKGLLDEFGINKQKY